ncbi:MAG: tRNA (adenosine(37)-N6)-threonylcarbamoyltransferase complex dimerization subunit type 1 TsaB [Hyphomicrobiales bacterium]|nr:tRNA (adenosine(37)-N6)-threonylcarbamoyltransferase complex dimerization subunit type 1 TsaB [Hyphomicrobiales bacterium]
MLILALDTAGENCAVALAEFGDGLSVLARRCEAVGRGHAERLMPMIGEALAEAGMAYGDLARIAVTTGPGSFTGTRIGVAAARGLALALAIPAVGVSVLDALIEAAQAETDDLVVAALDARRAEIYAKAVMPGGTIALEAQVTTAAALAQAIAGLNGEPVTLAGSAAAGVAQMLGEAGIVAAVAGEAACADIVTVAALAALGDTISPPVPFYLRAPDAKPQTGMAVARK